jgi:hypothetical protein
MKRLITTFLIMSAACFAADPEITNQRFQEFDQSDGKGWRALADAEKYMEAAQLIVRYLAEAKNIDPYRSILNFHAGQCYANAGETDLTVKRFQQAFQAEEPASYAPLARQWNAYVRCTIAFLKGDKKEVERSRDEVAAGPDGSMKESNVVVLDRLLRGVGRGYLEVYRGKKPNSESSVSQQPRQGSG